MNNFWVLFGLLAFSQSGESIKCWDWGTDGTDAKTWRHDKPTIVDCAKQTSPWAKLDTEVCVQNILGAPGEGIYYSQHVCGGRGDRKVEDKCTPRQNSYGGTTTRCTCTTDLCNAPDVVKNAVCIKYGWDNCECYKHGWYACFPGYSKESPFPEDYYQAFMEATGQSSIPGIYLPAINGHPADFDPPPPKP